MHHAASDSFVFSLNIKKIWLHQLKANASLVFCMLWKSSSVASCRYDLQPTEFYKNHTTSVKSWIRPNSRYFRRAVKVGFDGVFKSGSHKDLTYSIVKKHKIS